MLVPEESAVSGEGRRMSRFQYQVAGGVDESAFPLCIRPPQDVNDMASLFCQAVDYGIREFFPTFILV